MIRSAPTASADSSLVRSRDRRGVGFRIAPGAEGIGRGFRRSGQAGAGEWEWGHPASGNVAEVGPGGRRGDLAPVSGAAEGEGSQGEEDQGERWSRGGWHRRKTLVHG